MRKANKGCAARESAGRRGHGDSREAGEEEQRWARGCWCGIAAGQQQAPGANVSAEALVTAGRSFAHMNAPHAGKGKDLLG